MEQNEKSLLRKDLSLVAKVCTQYNISNEANARKLYTYVNTKKIFSTKVGDAFTARLGKIVAGQNDDCSCIVCKKQIADNGIVCTTCLNKIGSANNAHSGTNSVPNPKTDSEPKSSVDAETNSDAKPGSGIDAGSLVKAETTNVIATQTDAEITVKAVADNAKEVVKTGISETVKAAGWVKTKVSAQLEDEKTKEAAEKIKSESKKSAKLLKDKWNGLSGKGKLIVVVAAVFLVIVVGAGMGGNTGGGSVKDAGSARKVLSKEYSESDGWSITDMGTKSIPIGTLDTPVGKTTKSYQDDVGQSNNAELVEHYYSEMVTCWVFQVHKNGADGVQQGVIMVSPSGEVFAQGRLDGLPVAELNYRIR